MLAILQALINKFLLSGSDFSCGCRCNQCCPSWALSSSPGNFTFDGNSTIIVTDVEAFGSAIDIFPPSSITHNADGTITIVVCEQLNTGSCPSDLDYTCQQTDSNVCGIQYSTTAQSAWCQIGRPSTWPPVLQIPTSNQRALPWGAWPEGSGQPVPQAPMLVTANNPQISSLMAAGIVPGGISTSPALWASALQRLYSGNSTDPNGNVFNGEQLSLLGLQFGTDAAIQVNNYIEIAFEPVRFAPSTVVASRNSTPPNSMTCVTQRLLEQLDPHQPKLRVFLTKSAKAKADSLHL